MQQILVNNVYVEFHELHSLTMASATIILTQGSNHDWKCLILTIPQAVNLYNNSD